MSVRRTLAASAVLIGLTPVGVALSGVDVTAAPAAPDVVGCQEPGEGSDSDYPPAPPDCPTTTTPADPELQVGLLAPICDGDVPYLTYAVSAPGSSATTATITFINPGGANYVVSGVPLSGRILWPGAVIDASGAPLDWPGWTLLPDGTWTPGDEWNWTRLPVTVLVEVNPAATRVVEYPPATPSCVAGPRTPGEPGDPPKLPATGSGNTVPFATAGTTTVLLGAALMLLARRRTSESV